MRSAQASDIIAWSLSHTVCILVVKNEYAFRLADRLCMKIDNSCPLGHRPTPRIDEILVSVVL